MEEIAFALVIASCFPAGLKKGNAVTVRILGKILGPRVHGWLDVFGALFILTFFGIGRVAIRCLCNVLRFEWPDHVHA